MNPGPATIDIPTQEGEHAVAYDCRVRYLMLGPTRSIAQVASQTGRAVRRLEQYSRRWNWRESARRYDELTASIALANEQQEYLADLLELRKNAKKVGGALTQVALSMLLKIAGQLDEMTLTPASLGVAARALQMGIELQSNALNVHIVAQRVLAESHGLTPAQGVDTYTVQTPEGPVSLDRSEGGTTITIGRKARGVDDPGEGMLD